MEITHKQITVGNKVYGYSVDETGKLLGIRSETNPFKTPWLTEGSAGYNKVLKAINAQ